MPSPSVLATTTLPPFRRGCPWAVRVQQCEGFALAIVPPSTNNPLTLWQHDIIADYMEKVDRLEAQNPCVTLTPPPVGRACVPSRHVSTRSHVFSRSNSNPSSGVAAALSPLPTLHTFVFRKVAWDNLLDPTDRVTQVSSRHRKRVACYCAREHRNLSSGSSLRCLSTATSRCPWIAQFVCWPWWRSPSTPAWTMTQPLRYVSCQSHVVDHRRMHDGS